MSLATGAHARLPRKGPRIGDPLRRLASRGRPEIKFLLGRVGVCTMLQAVIIRIKRSVVTESNDEIN